MNKSDFRIIQGHIKNLGIGSSAVFYVYYIMYNKAEELEGVFARTKTKAHDKASLEALFYPLRYESILSIFGTLKGLKLISEDFDGFITIDSLAKTKVNEKLEGDVDEVLKSLNEICGTKYRLTTDANRSPVRARLRDGYSSQDLIDVINLKFKDWGADEKMSQYLRPTTLFIPSKFEGYYNSLPKQQTNLIKVSDPFGNIKKVTKDQFDRAEKGYFTVIN